MSELVARLRAAGCVFAEDEAAVLLEAASSPDDLEVMVRQRVAGQPLEQVVGWAEFLGRRILLEPGVFVPRMRTEFLVEHAAGLVREAPRREEPLVILDLCCGTGALGLALADLVECSVELHVADLDPVAVRCARRNVADRGSVHAGDLFDALPEAILGRVDVLVANVPYVPTTDIASLPSEARDYEPRLALDGGDDGLDVLRRVASDARRWLRPGRGVVLSESSVGQAPVAAGILEADGLRAYVVQCEELEATVVVGR